jgi:hypothetical protein
MDYSVPTDAIALTEAFEALVRAIDRRGAFKKTAGLLSAQYALHPSLFAKTMERCGMAANSTNLATWILRGELASSRLQAIVEDREMLTRRHWPADEWGNGLLEKALGHIISTGIDAFNMIKTGRVNSEHSSLGLRPFHGSPLYLEREKFDKWLRRFEAAEPALAGGTPSRAAVERFYRKYVSENTEVGTRPSRDDDREAAFKYFGVPVPRQWLRSLREQHAPWEWRRQGRRKLAEKKLAEPLPN